MKICIFFLAVVCGVAMAVPALAPADPAAPVPTTKPPGIPPAVLDMLNARLSAMATAPGPMGAKPFGPGYMGPYGGSPYGAGAPAAPGMPPAVAKMVKDMLKTFAAPAAA